ncbi:MAG: hypothetical protein NT105_07085 [Verrucomicrobia bacterium]|nr:hypothetical protein [Verrucomicrobiota bacterium]
MKSSNLIIKYVPRVVALLMASTIYAGDDPLAKPFTGHWEGSAQIAANWCKQRQLAVAIDIHPDGSVTGKVGDATLANARFSSNRSWLGRALGLFSDYIVRGDLNGPIVVADKVTRVGVTIPLDVDGDSFVGAVHSSGSKAAAAIEDRRLTALSLKLVRKQ